MKRKALGVLLSIMMLGTCVITGCGEGGSEAPASGSQAADTAESTETAAGTVQAGSEATLEYGGNDISEHKELVMYVIAVSYTHLDVYKRQAELYTPHFSVPFPFDNFP